MGAALRIEDWHSLGNRLGVELTLRPKPKQDLIRTGIRGADIPRGSLTEIFGPPSSGRTSIVHAALASVTSRPEFCALIDACDSFDPLSAAGAGVDLERLLWVRCGGSAENALKAVDLVVQAGGFGVVAIDLAGVPARDARRIPLASWFRLRHAVENTPTALIAVAQERNAGSCATTKIDSRMTGVRIAYPAHLLRNLPGPATVQSMLPNI